MREKQIKLFQRKLRKEDSDRLGGGIVGYEIKNYEIEKYETKTYSSEVYKSQIYSIDKYNLLKYSPEAKQVIKTGDTCDKYDYIAAVACGAIGGLVDIFLVGTPGDSKLGKWSDEQIDNAVKNFAKKSGWKPRQGNEGSIANAIGYLQRNYMVNYDQRYTSDVDRLFDMNTRNHHMLSLGHSPDIVGLFFSVLNQFTNTSSFIADGKLITVDTERFELYGGNFVMKIICGIANWFGHLMSDIAGSSSSHTRGAGIVLPFYEMFGFCKFGKFKTKKGIVDLAELAQAAYNQGYDARFGIAMAIPVIITDVTIRLIWGIRRYFQYEKPIRECIPVEKKHSDLRVMLLFGQGTLCLFDAVDAGIESGGCALTFFLHINLVAWFRFGTLVFKEICIRFKMSQREQSETSAYSKLTDELIVLSDDTENNEKNQKYINQMNRADNSRQVRAMVPLINN